MAVIVDRITKDIEGRSFYNSSLPDAIRAAQEHAGKDGYVASMPQLLH